MNDGVSSAEPTELYRYADRGRHWSDQLGGAARRLAHALSYFATSCTGGSTVAAPELADKLRRYLDDLAAGDAWVRQVGRGFELAGDGEPPRTSLQPGASARIHGTTPSAFGASSPEHQGNRALIGKPGGGSGRAASALIDPREPPSDVEPDFPDDVPPFDASDELWTQADVAGTFSLAYEDDRIRALRGGRWVCQPGGPAPAPHHLNGDATGFPESDLHFEVTRQGDAMVGEMHICWHGGDRDHYWAPAPLKLTMSSDGNHLTGTWDDHVHDQTVDVALSRITVAPLTPNDFGLPPTNLEIYGYGVKKVHRLDGTIANVAEAYIFDPETDERIVRHGGIDFTSRDESWLVDNLPFATPVGGLVHIYPDSAWNTIGLRLDTGDWLQFLHGSEIAVGTGQRVDAGTVLGKTGATGATTLHLHVQARSIDGTYVSPDRAVDRARQAVKSAAPGV